MKKLFPNFNFKPLCKKLAALRKSLGFSSASAFAKKLGVNSNTYWNYEHNTMPPTDLLATIKQKFSCDVDLDDFFNVRSGQALSTKNIDDRRNLSHKSIISRFKNPEIARVVNMKLLELEAIDENELIWLDGYLDGKLEEMRKYKKNKTEQ